MSRTKGAVIGCERQQEAARLDAVIEANLRELGYE